MKRITISKKEISDFFKESISSFIHSLEVKEKLENSTIENSLINNIDEETYLLGIDIDGNLLFTDPSVYISFSEAVFFQILDEDYLESIEDLNNYDFSNKKDLDYIKEMIEIKFKNKGIDLEINFE